MRGSPFPNRAEVLGFRTFALALRTACDDFHFRADHYRLVTIGFDTGHTGNDVNRLVVIDYLRFTTHFMREWYPLYARWISFDTLLMRENIPCLCVEIHQCTRGTGKFQARVAGTIIAFNHFSGAL
jgi:hypothetical protein